MPLPRTYSASPAPDASLATWAAWYAAQGIPVFPCRGKVPLTTHGFHDASCDAFQVTLWWRKTPDANIATPTGKDYWVLDTDPRNSGDTTWSALVQRYSAPLRTALCLTGGGGTHQYYLPPEQGGILHHTNALGAGLDVQALGGYVIVPPSIHPETGKAYAWDLGSDLESPGICEAPGWLLALVMGGGDRFTQEGGRAAGGAPDTSDGELILEGQPSRNKTLSNLGYAMRRAGFSYTAILAALQETNSRRCVPPLAGSDIQTIAWSATRASLDSVFEVGGSTSGASQEGPKWGGERKGLDFTQAVSSRELMKMMVTPPRFLIEGLIPDGLTILAAPAKSYKSFFSLSLALATIGACDWCGAFPVDELGPVVFFALESPLRQLRNRIAQLAPQYNPQEHEHEIVFFAGMQALPSFRHGLQTVLEQTIEQYHPRLIVIDPLSYLYRLGKQDDLMSATLDLLWPLAEMASQAGVALFAPEHLRKRSKDDVSVVDQLNGSHIKAAIVHALLSVQREGEDFTIDTTMRDAAPQHLTMHLGFDEDTKTFEWQYKGSSSNVAETRLESLKMHVFSELRDKRIPMSVQALIQMLGLANNERTKANLRQILARAEKAGVVAVSRRGEYYWIEQTV